MQNIYVLDTSVILFDSNSIFNFGSNHISIPIAVINELDSFKKGNEDINYHCREFIRFIDKLPKDKLFDGGVEINNKKGTISIDIGQTFHKDVLRNFNSSIDDHRIINCAYILQKRNMSIQVVLVSNDANMRIKAKSLNLETESYSIDKAKSTINDSEQKIIDCSDESMIDDIYKNNMIEFTFGKDLVENEYLMLKNDKKPALCKYNSNEKTLKLVKKQYGYGISPKNREQIYAMDALLDNDIQLVGLTGKAGTGKTLLALAAALEKKKDYKQIYIARPVIPLSNRDMGFLSGSILEKLDPYMLPLFDNLDVIKNQYAETDSKYKKITEMLENDKLVIAPLAYIRGRSLNNIYFIVDECILPGQKIKLANNDEIPIEVIYNDFHNGRVLFVDSFSLKNNIINKNKVIYIKKKHVSEKKYKIKLKNGKILFLTENHKLYVKNKGYTKIKDLTNDDILYSNE
jgi:PhoH-like ATPase